MASILILDRFYFPDEQATSVYLTELTRALGDKFQFDVLSGPPLVVTERNIPTPPVSRINQVPCLRLPKSFLFARFLNDFSFLLAALWRGLFLRKPDLVVSQTSPPGIGWVGFFLSRWHRVRWIHVCQDLFPDNWRVLSGNRNQVFFSFLDRVNSLFLKRTDRVLVVGEDMKEKLLKKGLSLRQAVCIPNWVDLKFVRPLSKQNDFSERYRLTDKFVVLYAGNFGRVHNFEDLLDGAERLRDRLEVVFVLVGEGALKPGLLQECRSRNLTNVLIAPFEPRSRLPEVLAAADVSVVLLKKGMAGLSVPSKIYSLLASARPILAWVEEGSDIARMVRESSSGFVIPPGNPEEFVHRVTTLYEDPKLKNELGANARRYAEKKDFRASAFRDYARVFREVLEGR